MDLCGCRYEGLYNALGLFHDDAGKYYFENGSVYSGCFRDGEFSGRGTLEFGAATLGMSIIGDWLHGRFVEGVLKFADGLIFHFDNWQYCDGYDRRFWREVVGTLPPSGQLNLTANGPPARIPTYTLDTGDGYYDPLTHEVYRYEGAGNLLRVADDEEHEFVMRNCARNWDADITDDPRNRYLDLPIGLPCHKRDAWKCGGIGNKKLDMADVAENINSDKALAAKTLQLELGGKNMTCLKSINELLPAWQTLLSEAPKESDNSKINTTSAS